MAVTILQLCQDACDEPSMNLDRPSTLFPSDPNGDTSARKLLRTLTRVTRDLAKDYDWQALMREHVFAAAAQEDQAGGVPTNFLRFVDETFWNRTARWRLAGPVSPDQRQEMKTWYAGAPVPYFWQRGDRIQMFPVPAAGQICAYEYVANTIGYATGSVSMTGATTADNATITTTSTTGLSAGMTLTGANIVPDSIILSVVTNTSVTINTVASKAATGQSFTARTPLTRFLADTNLTLWDDELIVRGIVYEYRKGERFDYAQDLADFEKCKADALKRDGGRRRINMRGTKPSTANDRLAAIKSAAVIIRS